MLKEHVIELATKSARSILTGPSASFRLKRPQTFKVPNVEKSGIHAHVPFYKQLYLWGSLFFFGCASAPSHIAKREEIMLHAASTPSEEIRILTINVWTGLIYKGFFNGVLTTLKW